MEKLFNIIIVTPIIFVLGIMWGVFGSVCYVIYGIYYAIYSPIKFLKMFWGKGDEETTESSGNWVYRAY